jgi:2Fe-2S ferredoxin
VGGPADLVLLIPPATAVPRRHNSRLSCQIKLQDGCEYHVTMPSEQV